MITFFKNFIVLPRSYSRSKYRRYRSDMWSTLVVKQRNNFITNLIYDFSQMVLRRRLRKSKVTVNTLKNLFSTFAVGLNLQQKLFGSINITIIHRKIFSTKPKVYIYNRNTLGFNSVYKLGVLILVSVVLESGKTIVRQLQKVSKQQIISATTRNPETNSILIPTSVYKPGNPITVSQNWESYPTEFSQPNISDIMSEKTRESHLVIGKILKEKNIPTNATVYHDAANYHALLQNIKAEVDLLKGSSTPVTLEMQNYIVTALYNGNITADNVRMMDIAKKVNSEIYPNIIWIIKIHQGFPQNAFPEKRKIYIENIHNEKGISYGTSIDENFLTANLTGPLLTNADIEYLPVNTPKEVYEKYNENTPVPSSIKNNPNYDVVHHSEKGAMPMDVKRMATPKYAQTDHIYGFDDYWAATKWVYNAQVKIIKRINKLIESKELEHLLKIENGDPYRAKDFQRTIINNINDFKNHKNPIEFITRWNNMYTEYMEICHLAEARIGINLISVVSLQNDFNIPEQIREKHTKTYEESLSPDSGLMRLFEQIPKGKDIPFQHQLGSSLIKEFITDPLAKYELK